MLIQSRAGIDNDGDEVWVFLPKFPLDWYESELGDISSCHKK